MKSWIELPSFSKKKGTLTAKEILWTEANCLAIMSTKVAMSDNILEMIKIVTDL